MGEEKKEEQQVIIAPNESIQSAVLLGVSSLNDTLSVDHSVLAHDGSRDGSVVPEQQQINEADICEDEIATNSNVFSQCSENMDSKTMQSSVDNSVDLIHCEAHQIIDELQQNLKELKDENEQNQKHHAVENDDDKQREIMKAAKNVWSEKMEQMIATTDEWFINEDGDIVLIYPQPEKEQNDKEEEVKQPLIEKNENENDEQINDSVSNNNEEVQMEKTETFFNSFRIF